MTFCSFSSMSKEYKGLVFLAPKDRPTYRPVTYIPLHGNKQNNDSAVFYLFTHLKAMNHILKLKLSKIKTQLKAKVAILARLNVKNFYFLQLIFFIVFNFESFDFN